MEKCFLYIFHLSYWENRYEHGGTSGEGSVGEGREWKWRIIDRYTPNLQSVVDVGCGDLSFWLDRKCKDYTGIDVSETILKKNKTARPEWEFVKSFSDEFIPNLKKECVFCFDILFHIVNEDSFVKTLHNLCHYSSRYLINPHMEKQSVFSKRCIKKILKDPQFRSLKYFFFPAKTDMKYQYFRLLTDYYDIFPKHGFQLIGEHENPNKEGCMYVFEKKFAP